MPDRSGLPAAPALAQVPATFETAARFAVLMDYESGTVIFQKDADARLEPACMTKLMTVAVVFNEVRAGRVKLDDLFFVSETPGVPVGRLRAARPCLPSSIPRSGGRPGSLGDHPVRQ